MSTFQPNPNAACPTQERDTSNDVTIDDIAATKLAVNMISVVGMVVSLMCGGGIVKVLIGGAISIVGTHLIGNQAKNQLDALNRINNT